MSATRTETDTLADVDTTHTPVCEVLLRFPGAPTARECRQEAVWVARITCCRFSLLVCGRCHNSPLPWECRKCGRSLDDAEVLWVRL
jgi:hypothetical protein